MPGNIRRRPGAYAGLGVVTTISGWQWIAIRPGKHPLLCVWQDAKPLLVTGVPSAKDAGSTGGPTYPIINDGYSCKHLRTLVPRPGTISIQKGSIGPIGGRDGDDYSSGSISFAWKNGSGSMVPGFQRNHKEKAGSFSVWNHGFTCRCPLLPYSRSPFSHWLCLSHLLVLSFNAFI